MRERSAWQCDASGGASGWEGTRLNIILVAGANARARTITLDWRHWAVGGASLFVLFLLFTFAFNFVTLKWAAAMQHPWLSAIVLADQREEAARVHERVQGHLNAMALRLGELQARMLRLDGLGERLAKTAGLKPQELPSLQPGAAPGRGGPVSSLPSRNLSVREFADMVEELTRQVDARSDQLSVLEALLVHDSANRKFLPTLYPVVDGWFSSNFGYRIDPFTGQSSMHEGIDFPAESGTPIVAAASGKIVVSEWHPAYGKMLEIDHGNGLVSRYAHTSSIVVKEGDFVVRGQRVATVGSTGRSTGPHLHFEVRLNGVPQNPARFLQSPNLS
jgi:murein DD-endopeptidase MepM/ murein hydrolase activator NlpD